MDKQVFTAAGADMGAGTVSGEGLRAWIKEAHERKNRSYPKGSSAVLIPFLIRDGAYHVLYEVRSAKLRSQPGEICFPGGRIEAGESPVETAVREATEELCIDRSRIEIVGALDDTIGPGAIPLFTYIAILHDYEGTWSHAEVDRVFTVCRRIFLMNMCREAEITAGGTSTIPCRFIHSFRQNGRFSKCRRRKNILQRCGTAGPYRLFGALQHG